MVFKQGLLSRTVRELAFLADTQGRGPPVEYEKTVEVSALTMLYIKGAYMHMHIRWSHGQMI